jgi:GNAT superfamily N-acetyltransferase
VAVRGPSLSRAKICGVGRGFDILPASSLDAPELAPLVAEGFASYREWAPAGWVSPETGSEENVARLRAKLSEAGSWGAKALRGGRVVGMAVVVRGSAPGVAHLAYLFVTREAWGTGVASALLGAAVAAARDAGFCELHLLAPAGQRRALRFYEREGLKRVGRPFLVAELGLPVVEMSRPLR